MNSKGEVFGLVYLEAMLANCITVASLNEGMDGIITHGKDGYLVHAGNTDELTKVIRNIQSLNYSAAKKIAESGYVTACSFTDSAVAKKYLESIEDWNK